MLMISSRERFWDPIHFSRTDGIRDVLLENPSAGVDTPVTEAEYLDAVRGRKMLLLVHGYNNTEDDVSLAYARIAAAAKHHFKTRYDVITGYTWPGGSLRIGYPIARARANAAGPRLAVWIRKVARVAASLDIMCHSLGARTALKALGALRGTPVRNLFLFAAAIDNESIEKGEEFYDATKRAGTVLVVHSRDDKALAVWFRVGDALLPWQWFDLFDLPLGYSGPEDPADIINHSPHVKVVNGKGAELGHHDYKDNPVLFAFLAKFLAGKTPEQFYTL